MSPYSIFFYYFCSPFCFLKVQVCHGSARDQLSSDQMDLKSYFSLACPPRWTADLPFIITHTTIFARSPWLKRITWCKLGGRIVYHRIIPLPERLSSEFQSFLFILFKLQGKLEFLANCPLSILCLKKVHLQFAKDWKRL